MTISKFDKATCSLIREKLNEALKGIEGLEGLTFEVGNMRYFDTEVTIGLKAKSEDYSQENDAHVIRMAKLHGIDNISANGWKIVDYHSKKRMYPFIMTNGSGTQYKMSPADARSKLN